MRQFIRHPSDIPIEISRAADDARGINVSVGGIALRCAHVLDPGEIVRLRIACVQPIFETNARVAWCRECDGAFELGIEFLDADDAFRARMVEQICAIESYKRTVYDAEGRLLTTEQAAMEWIHKYAAQFPDPDQDGIH